MIRRSTPVFVLSGASGIGKTTACLQTVALLQEAGVDVAGLVSPPRMERGEKTGIFVQDIRSGERRLLAERGSRNGPGWDFDPDALRWGSDILRRATPCAALVVDELGPLELQRNEGWTVALELLNAEAVMAALVVVRPALIDCLRQRLTGRPMNVISATPSLPTAKRLCDSLWSPLPHGAR